MSAAGSATGDGSSAKPWNLVTALSRPAAVKPGDTIWVDAGTYKGTFNSQLKGTIAAPIVVRAMPGKQVVVDLNNGDISAKRQFLINGNDTWFWGIEFTDSEPTRVSAQIGSHPTDMPRQQSSVTLLGLRIKLINCVIHEMANGVRLAATSLDSELYGVITFYNGFHAQDRGHGHGIYIQNEVGGKQVRETISLNNFYAGVHAYGQSGSVKNLFFDGLISVNNGSLEALFPGSEVIRREVNLLVGTTQIPTDNIKVLNSHFHIPNGAYATNLQLGYVAAGTNVAAEDSYFSGGFRGLYLARQTGFSVKRNTFVRYQAKYGAPMFIDFTGAAALGIDNNQYFNTLGNANAFSSNGTVTDFAAWKAKGFDAASTLTVGKPPAKVFVRPNAYEKCRAHIVVYNWGGAFTASGAPADISALGCTTGQKFQVQDAQNLHGAPVVQGTYSGQQSITIPLSNRVVTIPIGMASAPTHTGPDFFVFVVVPLP